MTRPCTDAMACEDAAEGFALDEALDGQITAAASTLVDAASVVALTGAGLSVESGIPPFRGPGGLWTKHGEPPLDGFQRFLADPRKAWQERLSPKQGWAVALHETLSDAVPNAGHLALVELERLGCCHWLITQNIDDLHRQAGTTRLLEIHGNHRLLRCLECVQRFTPEDVDIDPENLPPQCPHCGGVVKGDTVQFGEPIPADVLRGCYQAVSDADCMLVVGTSATVFPAAEFPYEVLRRGGSVIEVNPEPTELTAHAEFSLQGPGGAILERLLEYTSAAKESAA